MDDKVTRQAESDEKILNFDEVRELGDRAAAELAEQKDKSHDEIRKTYALLKRVDEIMARR